MRRSRWVDLGGFGVVRWSVYTRFEVGITGCATWNGPVTLKLRSRHWKKRSTAQASAGNSRSHNSVGEVGTAAAWNRCLTRLRRDNRAQAFRISKRA
ncbi:hypothetical protein MTO96_047586 [Rhipicephalus appendiculatus]